MIMLKGDEKTV